MPGRQVLRTGRAALLVAAFMTVLAALTVDLLAVAEPSHTVTLGIVAVVVACVRGRLAGRYSAMCSVVSGAIVAQPALHATSRLSHVPDSTHVDGLAHVVAEGPLTVSQIVVSVLAVVAVTCCSPVATVLLGVLCRRARLLRTSWVRWFSGSLPSPQTAGPGSALQCCGWAVRCARRGPPIWLSSIGV